MERLFLYYDLIELKLIACFVTLEIVKLLRRPMIIYSTIVLSVMSVMCRGCLFDTRGNKLSVELFTEHNPYLSVFSAYNNLFLDMHQLNGLVDKTMMTYRPNTKVKK